MAQNVPPTRKFKDVSGFIKGVNSFLAPVEIDEQEIVWAENASNRGGLWQTRPGFKTQLSLCLNDGSPFSVWWNANGQPVIHPQFFTIFTPTGANPQIVFGISGTVFTVQFMPNGSLGSPVRVVGLKFDPTIPQMVAVSTVKSADIVSGLVTNVTPYNVLIIQDGVSRAGYWDGTSAGHLNPQKYWKVDAQGNTLFQSGYNETRIGLWMDWSGNRLWVSNGNQVFSSDANDPLHFTEETVLVNVPAFTFPDKITAVKDRGVSGIQQGLVFIFTENDTWSLWSGVQNRSQWITTGDFQRRVFSGTGCVAGKSPVNHMGFMYWYSGSGIVSLDTLGTVTATQFVPPVDVAMAHSKRRMSPDKSLACFGSRDGYVFWSVPMGPTAPNGRVYNNHTQVLDVLTTPPPIRNGPFYATSTPTWQGVWTGIRPVEWATATIFGQIRCFVFSMDFDGTPRIWEAFQGNRSDNGQPISWSIQTKAHPVNESIFVQSIFRHFRILFEQIYGNLSVVGSWKGMRGLYHQLLSTTLTASPGSILLGEPSRTPITNSTVSDNFSKQFRDIRSMDNREPDTTCQSTGVEAPYSDGRDRAFSLLLQMKGVGAILAYRIASDAKEETTEGEVVVAESGFHELPIAECPEYIAGPLPSFVLNDSPLADAFTPYISTFPDTQYVSPAEACGMAGVAAPVFSPPGGNYFTTTNVSITTSTPGASIRYTNDGSIPSDVYGITYNGPIPVSSDTNFIAIAYKTGFSDSSLSTSDYNFECSGNNEWNTWINGVTANGGTFGPNSKSIACALITQLGLRSYSNKVKYMLPLLGSNLAAALVPLRNFVGASIPANVNFVNADFNESTGLQGDGLTKVLNTGVLVGQLGSGNNGGLGYWENNIPVSPGGPEAMGCYAANNLNVPDNRFVIEIGVFSWGQITNRCGGGGLVNGHFYGQRSSPSNRQAFYNGSLLGFNSTSDTLPGALLTDPIELMGCLARGNPDVQDYWNGRCAVAYMTDGTLTPSEIADFHSLLSTYLIAPTGR
jgi:hypothetical protein